MTDAMRLHTQLRGKIEMTARVPVKNSRDMALAYTPGVAEPCLEIQRDYAKSFELTRRWNTVAVITDGTAVLGLGDIGPEAGMPVMEGKCVLFKEFGGIDAIPLCLRTKDADELVRTIYLLSGSFGGINLEDISAPRCFEVERRLKEICDIPVFHDDQHGTAVVVGAALLNAVRLTGRPKDTLRVVISGAGSAGCAIARHLLRLGVRDIVLSDKCGLLCAGDDTLSPAHRDMAAITNPRRLTGTLADAMAGADVFIGVSAGNIVSEDMVRSMAPRPIVFAMANPVPEIAPDRARAAGAYVIGTGRSDFPNQINNVLAFPGIFRGALDVRASDINDEMKIAAAKAIASLVSDEELNADYIIPAPFNEKVKDTVAKAVAEAARATGVARI